MNILGIHIPDWLANVAVLVGPLVGAIILRGIAVRGTRRMVHSPARVFGNYLIIWALLLGASLLLKRVELPAGFESGSQKGLILVFIVSAVFFLWKIVLGAIDHWSGSSDVGKSLHSPMRFAMRLLIAILGFLVALDALNIPITPLLTTLGVGGIAIALALQETLSNFFAGVLIGIDRPIAPGQFVKLDTGEEGYIVELGWRSTRLRTISGNIIIVPNSKLGRTTITNFDLPDRRLMHSFKILVGPSADSRCVDKILVEVLAGAAGKLEGFLADPPPLVRFSAVLPTALEFTLMFQVRSVEDRIVEDELRHRALERFRAENIALPNVPPPPV